MVGVTAASVIVSVVVAIVAICNGRTAIKIANDAAMRDEENREAERKRLAASERASVAMRLLEVLESLVVWADTAPGTGSPNTPIAMAQFRSLRITAYSALATYPVGDTEKFRKWFHDELAGIESLGLQSTNQFQKVDAIAKAARKKIAKWSRGEWEPE